MVLKQHLLCLNSGRQYFPGWSEEHGRRTGICGSTKGVDGINTRQRPLSSELPLLSALPVRGAGLRSVSAANQSVWLRGADSTIVGKDDGVACNRFGADPTTQHNLKIGTTVRVRQGGVRFGCT